MENNLTSIIQNHLANLVQEQQIEDDDDEHITTINEKKDLLKFSGKRSKSSRKMTSFEKHLMLEEQSSTHMKRGKYFEAYGLLKTQHELGSKIHFASVLIKYYVSLMQTDRLENAKKIRDELCALLEEKFSDSCEEVCEYAHHLRRQNKFMEAVLFYQVSFHLCEKEKHLSKVADLSPEISCGLTTSCLMLLKESSVNKKTIRCYFIPLLKNIRMFAKETLTLDMKISSLTQAFCLRNIERCQYVTGDLKQQEETLNEAIAFIKQYHGVTENQFGIFGDMLGHLGINYTLTNRLDEAAKLFKQAIEALKKSGNDLYSPKEKIDLIDSFKLFASCTEKSLRDYNIFENIQPYEPNSN